MLPASDTRLYAVVIYESRNRDNTFNVQTNTNGEPFVLYLQSYEAVEWQVYGQAPKAIIYAGNASTVAAQGGPPVFRMDRGLLYYNFFDTNTKPNCHCIGNRLHCGDSGSNDKQAALIQIKDATGLALSGGSGVYGGTGLVVPTVAIDQTFFDNITLRGQEMDRLRQECSTTTSTLMAQP